MHPSGYFFGIPREDGIDIWSLNADKTDYEFKGTSDSGNVISCDMNEKMIVMGSQSGGLVSFSYTNIFNTVFSDAEDYGMKSDLDIAAPLALELGERKIIGMKKSGDFLVAIQQYMGARSYKQNDAGEYPEVDMTEMSQSKFFSSVDIDDGVIVMGSYDRKVYYQLEAGAGFSSLNNFDTTSQVLSLSLSEKKLLVGQMNGQITKHVWDGSAFVSEGTFSSNSGSKVLGVQSCPDLSVVALTEQMGWFNLVLFRDDGVIRQNIQLDEFVAVHFAVSSDCRRVFISHNMQQNVKVYVREDGQYSLFRTITQEVPLYDIAINPDADIFAVNRHTDDSTIVFKYDACTEEYKEESILKDGVSDDYAVQVTATEIILGNLDGDLQTYTYSSQPEECDPFGRKTLSEVTDHAMATGPRAVTALDIADNQVVAVSKYEHLYFFRVSDTQAVDPIVITPYTDKSIYISSVSISAEVGRFAMGSREKKVFVYVKSNDIYDYEETLETESQVTSVDFSPNNELLVGMMDGNVTKYTRGETSFGDAAVHKAHENSQIYGVKMCPDDVWVILLETEGSFQLKIYFNTIDAADPTHSFTKDLDEFIEPYLDATFDCDIVVVSGLTMQTVEVFQIEDNLCTEFKTVDVGTYLSKVSVEQDGDILTVPSIISPETYVYHYRQCDDEYTRHGDPIASGTYDEATAISGRYIVQGNEDGDIKISQYSWVYNITCPVSSASETIRPKNSALMKSLSASEGNPLITESDQTTSVMLILGAIVVSTLLLSICFHVRSKVNKKLHETTNSNIKSIKQMNTEQI